MLKSEPIKTINVSLTTWRQLKTLQTDWVVTMDAVIQRLLLAQAGTVSEQEAGDGPPAVG